jgi:hypothetical protein
MYVYIYVYTHICVDRLIWIFSGLDSAYERKYVISVFLSLTYFTYHDDLQSYPFS